MSPDQPSGDREWEAAWEDNRRAQMTDALKATPAQRLAWLEDAIELAYQGGAPNPVTNAPADPEQPRSPRRPPPDPC